MHNKLLGSVLIGSFKVDLGTVYIQPGEWCIFCPFCLLREIWGREGKEIEMCCFSTPTPLYVGIVVYSNLKLLGELFSYLDSSVPAKLLERRSTLKTPWQSPHWWVPFCKDGISLSGQGGQLNISQNPTSLICYRASKALSPVLG